MYLRLLTEKKASTGDGAQCAMRYYAVIGGPCIKIVEMFPQGSAVAGSPLSLAPASAPSESLFPQTS